MIIVREISPCEVESDGGTSTQVDISMELSHSDTEVGYTGGNALT